MSILIYRTRIAENVRLLFMEDFLLLLNLVGSVVHKCNNLGILDHRTVQTLQDKDNLHYGIVNVQAKNDIPD